MGRVRRYKKVSRSLSLGAAYDSCWQVKACDPFAKKKTATVSKKKVREMDLAPDETVRAMSTSARRRQERRWAREALGLDDDVYAVPEAPPRKVDHCVRRRGFR